VSLVRGRRRPFGWLVSVAAVSLVVAACGSSDETETETDTAATGDRSWEQVVAAAEEEGAVNVYTVSPPLQLERMKAGFEEAYPDITVNMTLGSGDLLARVESELQSGASGADAFLFSDPTFFEKHSADLLELPGPNAEDWPADFWVEEGKSIIPTRYPWTMFVWNTQAFPDGFETWEDLTAREVNGKLGVLDYVSPAMITTTNWMVGELGEGYFADLGGLSPKRYNSAVTMGQSVASGELGVAYLSTPSIVRGLQDEGAPVESAIPETGFALQWGGAALKIAENPNAAQVFMDWIMSPEGQEAVNGEGLGQSALPDIPGAVELPEGWEVFDPSTVTPQATEEYRTFITEHFGGVAG
jgi:iron(III) transport system substrate-binding protein